MFYQALQSLEHSLNYSINSRAVHYRALLYKEVNYWKTTDSAGECRVGFFQIDFVETPLRTIKLQNIIEMVFFLVPKQYYSLSRCKRKKIILLCYTYISILNNIFHRCCRDKQFALIYRMSGKKKKKKKTDNIYKSFICDNSFYYSQKIFTEKEFFEQNILLPSCVWPFLSLELHKTSSLLLPPSYPLNPLLFSTGSSIQHVSISYLMNPFSAVSCNFLDNFPSA